MIEGNSESSLGVLRRLTAPMAGIIIVIASLAWYETWANSDLLMTFAATPPVAMSLIDLLLFTSLFVVMMIAMMLPSALPMFITFRGLNRLQAGQRSNGEDVIATVSFASSYFLAWGTFGIVASLGFVVLSMFSPGAVLQFIPAVMLLVAGAYQFSRIKGACLARCQSPLDFVMRYWLPGRLGAIRMGLRHASYCLGCCWLLMIALFVVGSMSLPWMGLLSLVIFAEKAGTRQLLFSRGIGLLLILLGLVVMARLLLAY